MKLKDEAVTILKYPKGKNFVPVVSMSILGELQFLLYQKENLKRKLSKERENMDRVLNSFFDKQEMIPITIQTISLANKILDADYLLDPLDVLHFASAITGGCNSFIFIDELLNKSQTIKKYAKEHNVKLIPLNSRKN